MNDSYIFPCYTMTIGYPEETDKDVEDSISLVEYIIDHEPVAWIFPLPVIPMGLSKIRDNPLPAMERLPSRYWDLLYISWKYDLKITRKLSKTIANTSKNPLIRSMVTYIIDKVFNSIEWYFEQLKKTKGKLVLEYRDLNLNTVYDIVWSIFQLFRLSFSSP